MCPALLLPTRDTRTARPPVTAPASGAPSPLAGRTLLTLPADTPPSARPDAGVDEVTAGVRNLPADAKKKDEPPPDDFEDDR